MNLPELSAMGTAGTSGLAMCGGILTVDLDALAANYRLCRAAAPGAEVASIVKADAYGLGLAPVARALHAAGCRTFFIAEPEEGAALRRILPDAPIYVLNGLFPDAASFYRAHGLRPCLSSLDEIGDWAREAALCGSVLPAALHFDTGINRLGLSDAQAARLVAEPERLRGIGVTLLMSHLACADEAGHPLNERQLARFRTWRAAFPSAPASLANSAGLFLGSDYHFDLVRPGIGVYGGNPFSGRENPFRPVVRVEARLLQLRDAADGETAGYGASWTARGPRRLAILSAGYGDGYARALGSASGGGRVFIAGHYAPVAGRVSMDMLTVDVTGLPEGLVARGDLVEIMGPHVTLDELGLRAGTVGYEILTGLGTRYRRLYTGAGYAEKGAQAI